MLLAMLLAPQAATITVFNEPETVEIHAPAMGYVGDTITVTYRVLDAAGAPTAGTVTWTVTAQARIIATDESTVLLMLVAPGSAVLTGAVRKVVAVDSTAVVFREDFDDGTFGSLYLETCCTHSATVVDGVARIELRNTDPIVNSGQRAEITVPHQTGLAGGAGEERWFSWSVRPPSTWVIDTAFQVVTWQLHNFPDVGEPWRPPALQIEIQGAQWQFWVRSDSNRITQGTYTNDMIWTGRVDFGQWTDWVVHVKFAYDNTGVLEVWKNGEKVIDYRGPNAYNDEGQRYFEKAGLYIPNRSWATNGSAAVYTVDVDSWEIRTSPAGDDR